MLGKVNLIKSKFIYTCKFTIASRRVQHVLRLSDRLKVRQGRRHHLPVAERQVHHLIVRDVADGDGENSLGGYSYPRREKREKRERNVLIPLDKQTSRDNDTQVIKSEGTTEFDNSIFSLSPRMNVSRINRYFISIMNVVHASLIQEG